MMKGFSIAAVTALMACLSAAAPLNATGVLANVDWQFTLRMFLPLESSDVLNDFVSNVDYRRHNSRLHRCRNVVPGFRLQDMHPC